MSNSSNDSNVEASLQQLEKEGGYRLVDELDSGQYGVVYRMTNENQQDVAVKLVSLSEEHQREWIYWSKLDCKYLLPLFAVFNLVDLGLRAYVMPLANCSLADALADEPGRHHQGSLDILKKWLYQVLKAMDYLSSCQMCHLDIKCDNVLIYHDSRAVLCDFTFLDTTAEGPVERSQVGLPRIYRPPEMCPKEGTQRVDGEAIDLWSFGAMTLEALTGQPIRNGNSKTPPDTWKEDVRPLFNETLQEGNFFRRLSHNFPSAPLDEGGTIVALDFVHGFLMTDPKQRVKAAAAKTHCFLGKGRKCFLKKDCTWTEKTPVQGQPMAPNEGPKKGFVQKLRGTWKRVKALFKKKDKTVVIHTDTPNSVEDAQSLAEVSDVLPEQVVPPAADRPSPLPDTIYKASNDSGASRTSDDVRNLLRSLVDTVVILHVFGY